MDMAFKSRPVFCKPQWQIRKATEKKSYPLPVSNVLVIDYQSGKQKQVNIEVPSQVYKYLSDTFKNQVMPELVSFYLDEVADIGELEYRNKFKRWYLGIEYGIPGADKSEYLDLWYYTQSNLPAWVINRR